MEKLDKRKFLANYESFIRLKMWADRRLRALGQEEKGLVKGVGIWELDGKRAFESLSVSRPEYLMEQDQELGEILEEINTPPGRERSFLGTVKYCFRLSVAEELCLYLTMLPELEGTYGKIFSWLNGNPKKTRPTLEVAANVMGLNQYMRSRVREEMEDGSPFVRYLMEPEWGQEKVPFWERELALASGTAEYLLGGQGVDKELAGAGRTFAPSDGEENWIKSQYYDTLVHACCLCGLDKDRESRVRTSFKERRAVFLWGALGCGKKTLLRQLSVEMGKKIFLVEADRIGGEKKELCAFLRRAVRQAILTDSLLAVEHYESLEHEMTETFWEELLFCPDPILILSTKKPDNQKNCEIGWVPVHVENPSYEERRQIWGYYMEKYGLPTKEQNRLAAKFLFVPGQIQEAVRHYQNSCQILGEEKASLYESCFAQISHRLYERATKINHGYTWNQLILPDSQKRLMRHICSQMENKYKVYEEWGFGRTVAYGKGVTVVFAGPPGTGKTMAAQILSKELELELYKIDLSQMVSKYVGETEKNLASVFYEAELSNAILFFDEADSLFGRRTEVKSSHDRYANLETSYLLQRLEEYEGMTILATNYLKNIDDAFMRRMKYIISFPFPDGEARKQIWKVTIPAKAPMGQDMDYDFLGEKLELSGASIKNIAVYAAFLAVGKGCPIGMREILKAAQYEMEKTGKILLGKDLQQYGYLLEED